MMTATASGCSFFASSSTCRPSMPGILRSTSRIDQRSFLIRSTAVSPSGAVASVYPSFSSQADNDSRTISSSSTTRMRVRSLLMGDLLPLLEFAVFRPAVGAESVVLRIHLGQCDRTPHDAPRLVAVNQAEGVAELVDAFLGEPGGQQDVGGADPVARGQPRRRHDGRCAIELRLPIDE